MTQSSTMKVFEDRQVRSLWDDETEEWYFAIVDVVAVLTDSENPQVYWRVLKKRLKEEGNETVTNCNAFKMRAPDGKMRKTDVANAEQLFRIIQSIPSPKAEPFKLWIAKVAAERTFWDSWDSWVLCSDGGVICRATPAHCDACASAVWQSRPWGIARHRGFPQALPAK